MVLLEDGCGHAGDEPPELLPTPRCTSRNKAPRPARQKLHNVCHRLGDKIQARASQHAREGGAQDSPDLRGSQSVPGTWKRRGTGTDGTAGEPAAWGPQRKHRAGLGAAAHTGDIPPTPPTGQHKGSGLRRSSRGPFQDGGVPGRESRVSRTETAREKGGGKVAAVAGGSTGTCRPGGSGRQQGGLSARQRELFRSRPLPKLRKPRLR